TARAVRGAGSRRQAGRHPRPHHGCLTMAAVSETGAREPAAMGVRSAALWSMAGQYAAFAIQFGASVVISRFFLGPAEVGLFSIALAAALIVAILQDFGLSRYIAGLPRLNGTEISRCSSVALLFSLV